MTKLIHGIVHGQTIEVSEELGLSDGEAVELIVMSADVPESNRSPVPPKKLPGPPPGWKPDAASTTAGLLAEEWSEEDDRVLEQIQADRKAVAWRELPP